MSNYEIKIPAGLSLFAGTIIEPEPPTLSSLKDDILGLCLAEDTNADVVCHLVNAYIDILIEEDEEFELTDGDAEQVYRKYAIRGWREAVSRDYPEATRSRDDSTVYESCDWFEYDKTHWPAQLVAEIGYLVGIKNGRSAVAMSRYYEKNHPEVTQ